MSNLDWAQSHKPSATREKELRLAMKRIELGRSKLNATKLTFAAVALEVGISTALIHNHYPQIAELIRAKQGKSSRAQRDAKHEDLKAEKDKNRVLRKEASDLGDQVRQLTSINEMLRSDNENLRARISEPKVVDLAARRGARERS